MKGKQALVLSLAISLIAAFFLALPQQTVSAQCGLPGTPPCPPKKRPTATSIPPTPTSTPTATPTSTTTPNVGGGVSANPPGGAPNPGGEKGFEVNWMPVWLLGGGLLLGLLIVGFIWFRNRLGKTGGEKGIVIVGGTPNPELGGPDTLPPPDADMPGEQGPPDPIMPGGVDKSDY